MTRYLTRRRFLAVSAATLAAPAHAAPIRWRSFALGAEVSLTLHAQDSVARRAIASVQTCLRQIEQQFSLYNPTSAISTLNRTGILSPADDAFLDLMALCDRMHIATGGVFDPTVQPLWRALATNADVITASETIGWDKVRRDGSVQLAPGQALTFNGIAQGFATDMVRSALAELGLTRALVNIGEFAALGGPFRLGVADPAHGLFAERSVTNGAIATSSPGAMQIAGRSHILAPDLTRVPQWSTVSVESSSAAMADAASTAFSLMTAAEINATLTRLPDGTRATVLAGDGSVTVLG